MRIGLITGEYPPMEGGVGAYSQVLARHIAAQGHAVFLLTHALAAESDARVQLDTITGWGPGSLKHVQRWTQTIRPDIISLQFETAAYAMSPWVHLLPRRLSVPVITTFHDLLVPYLFPKAGPLREWIVMHLARTSSGVIVTNHEDHSRLQHLPNTAMIPIGSNIRAHPMPPTERDRWRQAAGAAPGDFLIGYFGFLHPSKGVDTLLAALLRLRDSGKPARLVMIGGRTGSSDPTNRVAAQQLDRFISQNQLAPLIHWTGFADEASVSGFLRASDAVALPFRDGASYRRGSLMAAIAHGCAIVTTQPRVDMAAFRDGETLCLIPPDDPHALATALEHLAAEPALQHTLSRGAAQLAHLFDWEHIAQSHIAFFQRCLSSLAANEAAP